jgi:hypothetical protein
MEAYSRNGEFQNAFASGEDAEEAFTMCPKAFLQYMTPEEMRSTQQLYQVAFEKAQRQVAQNMYRRLNPSEFVSGEGI